MEIELYRAAFAVFIAYWACKCLLWAWVYCLRQNTDLLNRYLQDRQNKTAPCWAVVTGPTRGIGRQFCFQLADQGFSVLVVGRPSANLDRVLDDLRNRRALVRRGAQGERMEWACAKVEIDFKAMSHETIKSTLVSALRNKDVAVLVNNVGTTLGPLSYFTSATPLEIAQLCDVNIRSTLLLTRLLLPGIVDRGSGAILSMSSLSAMQPSPMLSCYAATKAFMHSLSRSLSEEVAQLPRVDILSVAPGFVDTDLSRELFGTAAHAQIGKTSAGPSIVVVDDNNSGSGSGETYSSSSRSCCSRCSCCRFPPAVSAEDVVSSVLRQLGNGFTTYTFGHWKHSLQHGMMSIVPAPILSEVTHSCMRRWKGRAATEKSSWSYNSSSMDDFADVEELLDDLDLDEDAPKSRQKVSGKR